ncbi:MAG: class I SAM-dependent RNA methyltransferase [Chloroflexota bacterium]
MSATIQLIAITKFGLEKIVRRELSDLGFEQLQVMPGQVRFAATVNDIPKANIWLRCADRVLLTIGEFRATTFDDLFEQTKALPWEQWITADGKFTVNGKSVRSTLRSVRSCQSIVKKAVVERLKTAYELDWFAETGANFTIQVSLLNDKALLTLDTSGAGLHKRGYRAEAGEAPLKETLAAGLVQLSFWNKDRLLLDPMCGSGTILIEAAMRARNMAPGLKRPLAAEKWPSISPETWTTARAEAKTAVRHNLNLRIFGHDIDGQTLAIAKQNAAKAGVNQDIVFTQQDIKKLWIDQSHGIVITNPPYGVRLAEFQSLNQIYIALNKMFRKKKGWSLYLLTADDKFPRYFKRAKPNRVRKLYNGNIQANYYQYYGERPK